MESKSLNEITQIIDTAMRNAGAIYDHNSEVLAKKIISFMGGASTRKDEGDTAQATLITPPNELASEISVNEHKLQGCIVDELAKQPVMSFSRLEIAKRIIDRIRPYLRTTEPVSVDVDAGTLAFDEAYKLEQDEYLPTEEIKRILQKVAKAWGLECR